jgi:hypothetical protein
MKTWKQSTFFGMVAIIAFVFGFFACGGNDEKNWDKVLSGAITISPTTAFTGEELTANYNGSETVNYQWNKNGTAIGGKTAQKITPTGAGSYTVTVSLSGYESKTSEAVAVTVQRNFTIIIKKTVDGEDIEIGIAVKDTRTGADDKNLDELGIIETLEGGFNELKLLPSLNNVIGREGFTLEVEDTIDYEYYKAYSATRLAFNIPLMELDHNDFIYSLEYIFDAIQNGPYPQQAEVMPTDNTIRLVHTKVASTTFV